MSELINFTILTTAVVVLFVLNIVLFIWINRLSRHYRSLTSGVVKKDLMSVLEGIQKTLSTHERSLVVHKKELAKVVSDAEKHLQHMSLKRFNPFSDTGGDQSFILSLLDGNQDGVVITSLHSRENTRFYVKTVRKGEGVEHPLSKEEKKIVDNRS